MKRTILILIAFLPLLAGMSGYPSQYSAESIEAWVVDSQTKKPIEGVIVVAHWELEDSGYGGNVPVGQLQVMEVVTDKDGRFYFPAWGPIRPRKGGLRNRDPEILFFKPGYKSSGVQNEFRNHMYEEPVRRSEWNGKKIELIPLFDQPISIGPHKYRTSVYAEDLSKLSISLTSIVTSDCNWKNIPRILLALRKQRNLFREQGIGFSVVGADNVPTDEKRCGRPEEFFQQYRQ